MNLTINGEAVEVNVAPGDDRPLLWVLREDLALTGTKFGCGVSACGACTVLVDGQPTRSCVTPAATLEGRSVTTIEGLDTPQGKAVQQAWTELDVVQCGWCQSGQILAATALLTQNASPTEDDVNTSMSANICRCATYDRIRNAVVRASQLVGSE